MSGDDLADQAAEPDEEPAPGAADAPDAGEGATFIGRCHGGPWDGTQGETRFPKGFLLIHMPTRRLWIYDRRPDGDFYVRETEPAELQEDGPDNRWRAADEGDFDIRVLDPDAVTPASECAVVPQ